MSDVTQGFDQAEIAYHIPIDLIEPDPEQPRKQFDQAELDELKATIKENGLRIAIHVRPSASFEQDHRFVIVAGERRWRCCKALGHTTIRAIIMAGDIDAFVWSFVENYSRSPFTPMEEAMGFAKLIERGLTVAQVAERVGKAITHVYNTLLLLELPLELQDQVAKKKLQTTAGMLLVKECDTQNEMTEVVKELTAGQSKFAYKRLTVKQIKAHIERRRQQKKLKESGVQPMANDRLELAKSLEPTATELFGLLDELVSIGEENPADFHVLWGLIPKPQRSGIIATLKSIKARIEKTESLIDLNKAS